jgi:MAX-like protein X
LYNFQFLFLLSNRKREPHNYEKLSQPTAHQTTIYNQMLAAHQETAQLYSNNAYGANLADLTNINHMSPIQTTTNNFNAASETMTTQNVLNLSNSQMGNFSNKMMMQQLNQMPIEQQQQQQQPMSTSHDSYKSPQSPSYRYHQSNQPYKIPSQSNTGYNATSRIMMRQQSPPHHGAGSSIPSKSMSFQQQNATAAAIKEMYRSNSLPINANILLPSKDASMGSSGGDNFAMPKYPQTAKKERRGSAVSLRQNQMMVPTLQSANSEPALNVNNSALAQLLTNPASLLSGTKAHSVSSSAMSAPPPQQPVRANSFTSTSLIQSSILNAINSHQKVQPQQQPSSSTSTPTTSGLFTPTLSPDSAFQDSNDMSSHSPERGARMGSYHPRESQRRAGHIHAEQKRRYNIKNGFDMLHSLIPQLQQNPNAKVKKKRFLKLFSFTF